MHGTKVMKFSKKYNFILLFFVFLGANVSLASQPSPTNPSNLTVYSGAGITIGANSTVYGSLQSVAATTLGATVIVYGNLLTGAAVTLGVAGIVGGDLIARDAGTIGAGSTIFGNLTTGDAATLGATSAVNGDLTAGAAILVGAGSTISGNLTSGFAAAANLGAHVTVGLKAMAGAALTLGAGAKVGPVPSEGESINSEDIVAQAGTNVTVPLSATLNGGSQGGDNGVTKTEKGPIASQKATLMGLQQNLAARNDGVDLAATMTMNTTLTPGVYHAPSLTTTAGITLTFDSSITDSVNAAPVEWIINVDTFIDFGANLKMVMKVGNNVPNGSTITFNSGGYTAIGANSIVIGTVYAGTYITTGAGTSLSGVVVTDPLPNIACGGMFATNGAITLGANNTIGALDCTPGSGNNGGSAQIALNTNKGKLNLGTAGDFVILSKTGISTTGVTQISGDLGVSPAAETYITGFGLARHSSGTYSTSSLVEGGARKIFAADLTSPTPGYMTKAVSDMEVAYTDAAGRAPDMTELHAGNIGGKTLPAGIYKWSTDVWIDNDLTLKGGANDVWIFQISGDLIQASGTSVILSNGAQAKNVFWQVAGGEGVVIDTTALFNGVILTYKKIVVRTGATVNGKLLSQTAVTLDANVVTSPDQ
jgi:predicted acyltransferase (DUF342 family)